ncbi:fimbrial biogenesis chaperone [Intestinirhabdus alba]|jgi:P pilus assembly chaperone PapD|uniref:Fimbria/pilus periplasmic chaperone n=1 Tax=Intestinirhabdus alba TaxID=2899544 RepID=A0A6L6IMT5_9ENTR|nr:molecular chaperone [Intestinirhabdus alba]MTH47819.1 fimbria/pilus periplasmic chaperone [Intestinirhabdus alba]
MRIFILLISGLLSLFSCAVSANVVINGTRVIYPGDSKEVVIQLVNNGPDPALVQSWIDDGDVNSTPETSRAPFLLSPPVVKIDGGSGQQLRIKKLPDSLPADRESIFYLNVLDIPPVPENVQGMNTLQLAIKSRIKLFVRPQTIKSEASHAIDKVSLTAAGQAFRIVNRSPFFITLASIDDRRGRKMLEESLMVAPFSDAIGKTLAPAIKAQTYSLIYVDDLGAYKHHDLIAQ